MEASQSQSEPWRGQKEERKAGQGSGSMASFLQCPFSQLSVEGISTLTISSTS